MEECDEVWKKMGRLFIFKISSGEATIMVVDDDEVPPDMSLQDITDGDNGRGIPAVLFVDDITAFAESFTPHAQAELLIGAYTQLHSKYKSSEASLKSKRTYDQY